MSPGAYDADVQHLPTIRVKTGGDSLNCGQQACAALPVPAEAHVLMLASNGCVHQLTTVAGGCLQALAGSIVGAQHGAGVLQADRRQLNWTMLGLDGTVRDHLTLCSRPGCAEPPAAVAGAAKRSSSGACGDGNGASDAASDLCGERSVADLDGNLLHTLSGGTHRRVLDVAKPSSQRQGEHCSQRSSIWYHVGCVGLPGCAEHAAVGADALLARQSKEERADSQVKDDEKWMLAVLWMMPACRCRGSGGLQRT